LLTLTQEHINRAFRIASWYGRRARRAEISDLESAALEGLAKAARDWDPQSQRQHDERGELRRSFWSFAFTRILGEMRDELRRFDHLTRTQRAKVVEDEQGTQAFADQDLEWVAPHEPVSLDATFAIADDAVDPSSLSEAIPEARDHIAELELRDAVFRAGACLPERVRLILVKRDLEGYSNDELAQELELSRGRVSQLRNAGFEKMRGHIGDSLRDVA
jgi:RNA polymerase sigma factor (sigma-70 family)